MSLISKGDLVRIIRTEESDIENYMDLIGEVRRLNPGCRNGFVYEIIFPEPTVVVQLQWFRLEEVELVFTV